MMLFRPVRENDLDDIIRLASRAGVGMTSLPNDPARLAARIQRSVDTFAGRLPRGQQGFLFVPLKLLDLEIIKKNYYKILLL